MLTVYNVTGEQVRQFAGYSEAGMMEVVWDGRNDRQAQVASGIYMYRLTARDFSATRKMVLLK